MAKRKKSSRKRKSTIKLPLSVIITLIIIAAIVIGVWATYRPGLLLHAAEGAAGGFGVEHNNRCLEMAVS